MQPSGQLALAVVLLYRMVPGSIRPWHHLLKGELPYKVLVRIELCSTKLSTVEKPRRFIKSAT